MHFSDWSSKFDFPFDPLILIAILCLRCECLRSFFIKWLFEHKTFFWFAYTQNVKQISLTMQQTKAKMRKNKKYRENITKWIKKKNEKNQACVWCDFYTHANCLSSSQRTRIAKSNSTRFFDVRFFWMSLHFIEKLNSKRFVKKNWLFLLLLAFDSQTVTYTHTNAMKKKHILSRHKLNKSVNLICPKSVKTRKNYPVQNEFKSVVSVTLSRTVTCHCGLSIFFYLLSCKTILRTKKWTYNLVNIDGEERIVKLHKIQYKSA